MARHPNEEDIKKAVTGDKSGNPSRYFHSGARRVSEKIPGASRGEDFRQAKEVKEVKR